MIEATMGEIRRGPLDIAREANEQAVLLDELIIQDPEFIEHPGRLEYVNELAAEIDALHPYANRRVRVTGHTLTPSVKVEEEEAAMTIMPLATTHDDKQLPVEGTYHGVAVRPVYIPEIDETVRMVVHLICTDVSQYLDEYYNVITRSSYTHILVAGSEMVPVVPQDAHSLTDLKEDEVTADLEGCAFSEILTVQTLQKIGKLLNEAFFDDILSPGINNQRISYLNSLHLFDKIRLVSEDYLVVEDDEAFMRGQSQELTTGKLHGVSRLPNIDRVALEPDLLMALRGYEKRGNDYFSRECTEVFAVTEIGGGKAVYVPLASIIGTQAREAA